LRWECLRRGVVVPRMKDVVSAMAENQGGDDIEEETDGANDKDELGIFDRWVSFHEPILLTDDDIWQIWIGRHTFHMDEFSNAL
jgi:hypothetical protein